MYKRVELQDGVPVQFVGVYITRWHEEWGVPSVGFTEADYQLSDAVAELDSIKEMNEVAYHKVLSILKKIY